MNASLHRDLKIIPIVLFHQICQPRCDRTFSQHDVRFSALAGPLKKPQQQSVAILRLLQGGEDETFGSEIHVGMTCPQPAPMRVGLGTFQFVVELVAAPYRECLFPVPIMRIQGVTEVVVSLVGTWIRTIRSTQQKKEPAFPFAS